MLARKLAITALTLGFMGFASQGFAQGPPEKSDQGPMPRQKKSFSLADELDGIGQSLFGDILPSKDKTRKPAANQPQKKPTQGTAAAAPSRTGTTSGSPNSPKSNASDLDDDDDDLPAPSAHNAPSTRSPAPLGRPVRRPTVETATLGNRPTGNPTGVRADSVRPIADPDNDIDVAPKAGTKRPTAETSQGPTLRPLHERLSAFRQSAFPQGNQSQRSPTVARQAPVVEMGSASAGDASPGMSVATDPPAAVRQQPTPAVAPTNMRTTPSAIRMPESGMSGRPVIAPRGLAPYRPENRAPTETSVAPRVAVRPDTPARSQEDVLIARKSPILSVETVGPRKITVGRESVYGVTLVNSGEVAAEDVVVFVNLPAWADVVGAEASTGATQLAAVGEPAKPFQWKIGQVAANGKERLALRLIPRESRPFDLAVRWDYKPVASQTMIEVQEPKLAMRLEGPREVLYGRRELFTLKLANSGTGDAENVVITLAPVGTGDNQPVSQKIGVLAAGEEKSIEVELTARQSEDLQIQVEARGDGNVQAQLAEKVLVRRAAMQVEVEGPQMQYVGSVSTYRIRVHNPGTAPARNIKLTVAIPPGAKYLSGIDSAAQAANGTRLQWTIDTLNPRVEQVFAMKCNLGLPGANKVEVNIAAEDDLTATAATVTRVEAMADLVLEVKDPARPVPVGEDAVYELRIRNRGTKSAEGVEVVAFFSRGVEPVAIEGGQGKLAPGQVIFQPIPSVAPGADLVLKIHARAEAAGSHVFRTEVSCKPLGTRLANEQTTHFYQDGSAPQQATRPAPNRSADVGPMAPPHEAGPGPIAPPREVLPVLPRTADRREPGAVSAPPQGQPIPMPLQR